MKENKNVTVKKSEKVEERIEGKTLTSEFSTRRRNFVFIGIGVYIFSFFILALIGDSINKNPYNFLSFLAPILYLSGIILILLFLTQKKFLKSNLDNN